MQMVPFRIMKNHVLYNIKKIVNMKLNILQIAFTILLFNIQCKSQIHIINMAGDNIAYPHGYLSNGEYYIKDINNNLDNFVGTWEYINGNEKFQIILTKKIKHHNFSPLAKLNYYKDGLLVQYKKYNNNLLVFESPISVEPWFTSKDGILLEGGIKDYGRLTKNVYLPLNHELAYPGGAPVDAKCEITIISINQIKFHLHLRQHFPNYNKEAYEGQPLFSVPNDVIMTKVP